MAGSANLHLVALLAGAIAVAAPVPLRADLVDLLQTEPFAGLELAPLGTVLANTVASTYPVASASSSVVYVYDPSSETFERQTGILGPIIGERAETIGEKQIDISLSYSYVKLSTINGNDLSHLVNQPVVDGRIIAVPVPDYMGAAGKPDLHGFVYLCGDPECTPQNQRFTNFLPAEVLLDLDVEAQILTPAVTYGLTPDLDVNITLPLLRTFLRVQTTSIIPDPRPELAPLFRVAPPYNQYYPMQQALSGSDDAVGVGDLLLRAKYVVTRNRPVDVAAFLAMSLPTGNEDNLQGTGAVQMEPTVVVSRVIVDRFEPLLNLGVDLNADDVGKSSFQWAVGSTVQIAGPLTGALVFLGRNEFEAQTDPIPPFFFQIERNDFYDISMGFRYLIEERGVLSANVIVPLNDDGFRADAIPTFQVEYVF